MNLYVWVVSYPWTRGRRVHRGLALVASALSDLALLLRAAGHIGCLDLWVCGMNDNGRLMWIVHNAFIHTPDSWVWNQGRSW
jgi:hypothetical protein